MDEQAIQVENVCLELLKKLCLSLELLIYLFHLESYFFRLILIQSTMESNVR